MKFFSTAPIILAAAVLTASNVSAAADSDAVKCLRRHPNLYTAITQFCSRNDIVTPSSYAHKGVWSGGKFAGIG